MASALTPFGARATVPLGTPTEANRTLFGVLAGNEREKSKKGPPALASYLKNHTKVTVPTPATEGTDGLDNVTLQKLKHSPSAATQPSL